MHTLSVSLFVRSSKHGGADKAGQAQHKQIMLQINVVIMLTFDVDHVCI